MAKVQRKRRPAKRAMAARIPRRRPASDRREEVTKLLRLGTAGHDPGEGLRLLTAFLKINDPALRTRLIQQAEEMASKSGRP